MSDRPLTPDEEQSLAYVAEACQTLAAASGMTPEEVYDAQFAGRDFTVQITANQVEFVFDDPSTSVNTDCPT